MAERKGRSNEEIPAKNINESVVISFRQCVAKRL